MKNLEIIFLAAALTLAPASAFAQNASSPWERKDSAIEAASARLEKDKAALAADAADEQSACRKAGPGCAAARAKAAADGKKVDKDLAAMKAAFQARAKRIHSRAN